MDRSQHSPLPEVIYTVTSLAEYLSVSKSFVYKLAASGRIRLLKVGKELRFTDQHVAEYLAACDTDNGPRGRSRVGRPRKRPPI